MCQRASQALAIRPDILSPAAMTELQKLCDKVPAFDNKIAMATIESELGGKPEDFFVDLTPDPIAAASLGQVRHPSLEVLIPKQWTNVFASCFESMCAGYGLLGRAELCVICFQRFESESQVGFEDM